MYYEDKEMQDIMNEYYQIKRNLNFLEEYNRYRAEIFSVNITFDELSNDISHFIVAQNFIISTCLSYVDIYCFCQFFEEYNRYRAEIFRVYITFNELSYDISFVFVA